MRRGQTVILNLVAVLALGGFLWLAEGNFDGYKIQDRQSTRLNSSH